MPVLTMIDWMWRLGIDALRRTSFEQGARRPSGDHAGSEQVSRRSSGDRVRRMNMPVMYRNQHTLLRLFGQPIDDFQCCLLGRCKTCDVVSTACRVMLLALHVMLL